jgi:hypothetical protein
VSPNRDSACFQFGASAAARPLGNIEDARTGATSADALPRNTKRRLTFIQLLPHDLFAEYGRG